MQTQQLETFLRVAEAQSMNRAADALYMSASAVKKQIDALEAELGVELFYRDHMGCALTSAGKCLTEEAPLLIDQIKRIRQKVQSAETRRIIVCDLEHFPIRAQDGYILRFENDHPDIEITQLPLSRSRWLDAISTGLADCCFSGICTVKVMHSDGTSESIFNARLPKGLTFISRKPGWAHAVCLVSLSPGSRDARP